MSAHRLRWSELPRAVRDDIEAMAGATVVRTESGTGGYSPSFASRCDLSDGRRVFAKAVSSDQNPESPDMLRREMDVTRRLPASVPAPRLLDSRDDGNWVAGVFEHVDGRPPRVPWEAAELDLVVDAIACLGATDLTPALAELDTAEARSASMFGRWTALAADPPAGLDKWARAHVGKLVQLESGWRDAVRGDAFVHLDVRSDNVLITDAGAVLVDWPHACIGAPGLDLLAMLPSVALEGGGEPEAVLARTTILASWDPRAIDAIVAALAGYFVDQSRLPDPPGLPTVRAFQRAQGEVTLRWLQTRLGDPVSQ